MRLCSSLLAICPQPLVGFGQGLVGTEPVFVEGEGREAQPFRKIGSRFIGPYSL